MYNSKNRESTLRSSSKKFQKYEIEVDSFDVPVTIASTLFEPRNQTEP